MTQAAPASGRGALSGALSHAFSPAGGKPKRLVCSLRDGLRAPFCAPVTSATSGPLNVARHYSGYSSFIWTWRPRIALEFLPSFATRPHALVFLTAATRTRTERIEGEWRNELAQGSLVASRPQPSTAKEKQVMATLTNATLRITVNAAAKTAQCVATCRVHFTAFELNQMAQGLRFVLHSSLWGEDGTFLNPDDFLFSYASQNFPDSSPSAIETATFNATVGLSLLNEDWGTDEVYALLTLKNLYTNNTIKAKTNVVKRDF
jgi:hypothetical protein